MKISLSNLAIQKIFDENDTKQKFKTQNHDVPYPLVLILIDFFLLKFIIDRLLMTLIKTQI